MKVWDFLKVYTSKPLNEILLPNEEFLKCATLVEVASVEIHFFFVFPGRQTSITGQLDKIAKRRVHFIILLTLFSLNKR